MGKSGLLHTTYSRGCKLLTVAFRQRQDVDAIDHIVRFCLKLYFVNSSSLASYRRPLAQTMLPLVLLALVPLLMLK